MVDSVRAALPKGWQADVTHLEAATGPSRRPDAVIRVSSPSNQSAEFGLETKSPAAAGSLSPASLQGLRAVAEANGWAGFIVFSPYLSAPARAALDKAGVSYADSTGWVRLVSDRPMLAIAASGAERAPNADPRRQTLSLKGASAGRIMRALLSCAAPVGVRELAAAAEVSPGSVSKTLPLLTAEGAVRRDAGKVVAVDRREVLRRWTLDYRVLASNGKPAYFVAPRGIDAALATIKNSPRVVLTGSQAGALWLPGGTAPLIPVTQLIAYTDDADATASRLGLVPVDAPSANVIVLPPQDQTILDNPARKSDIPIAPLPLVLADLLTLPGRYPQQAEALMNALAKTDPEWRP
ncbi:MAG: hypothetical protein LBD77_07865 [Bifidobacteriaceae bacterium]|nr:hypothetical protein [Bifidobacteriaceae bacterium]